MKYEITAKRIREAMNDAQMTQQDLADKSEIGKSSISHYVNGTNEPGNRSAYLIAKALNVNPAWIMGLDAPKHLPHDTPKNGMTDDEISDLFSDLRGCVLFTKTVYNSLKAVSLDDKPVTKQELSLFLDMMDCSLNLIRNQRKITQTPTKSKKITFMSKE